MNVFQRKKEKTEFGSSRLSFFSSSCLGNIKQWTDKKNIWKMVASGNTSNTVKKESSSSSSPTTLMSTNSIDPTTSAKTAPNTSDFSSLSSRGVESSCPSNPLLMPMPPPPPPLPSSPSPSLSPSLLSSSPPSSSSCFVLPLEKSPNKSLVCPHDPIAKQFSDLNDFRAHHKLPLLKLSKKLTLLCQTHCQDMVKRRSLDHSNFLTDRVPHGARAENVACGQKNMTQVMDSWDKSTGHRTNMLKVGFPHYGIAFEKDPSTGLLYWCLILGHDKDDRPSGQP